MLLHQIEYDFDYDLAIEYLNTVLRGQIPKDIDEWNESDFISYIKKIEIEIR